MKTTRKIMYDNYEINETDKAFSIRDYIDETERIRINKSLIEKLDLDEDPLDVAIFLYQIEIERYNARRGRIRPKSFIREEEFASNIKEILKKMHFELLCATIEGMNYTQMKIFFLEKKFNIE